MSTKTVTEWRRFVDAPHCSPDLAVPVALDIGSHFAIREGGKTVGSGVITEIVL